MQQQDLGWHGHVKGTVSERHAIGMGTYFGNGMSMSWVQLGGTNWDSMAVDWAWHGRVLGKAGARLSMAWARHGHCMGTT